MLVSVALAAPLAWSPLDRPWDIYARGGTPCVAAHSTTRALYAAYDGPLYRVTYGKVCAPCVHHKGSQCCSAGNDTDIGLLEAGGFANISTQDAVCAKGDCVISLVYDQSGKNNHLGQRHMLVNASKHKIIVGDKTLEAALDKFERGNTTDIEGMIQRGEIQRNDSVDFLENLDFAAQI